MSYNTILATAPLTSTGYHLKATGTTIGNSLIWDNGTNVGIGNTNTSYTLDVTGTGRFKATGNAYSNGSIILTNSSGATSTYMTNSGGIFYLSNNGTTDHLQISSSGAATFSSTLSCSGAFIQLNQTEIFPSAGASNRAFAFQLSQVVAGDFSISSGSTATGGTYTPRLYINPSGNVGINTSTFNYSSANRGYLAINGTTDNFLEFQYGTTGTSGWINGSSSTLNLYTSGPKDLLLGTTATERMRITSAGQIYNSNAPAGDWGMRVFGNSIAGSSYGFKVLGGTNSSDDSMLVTNYSGGTAYLRIRGDGAFYTGSGSNSPMNATTGNAANVYIDNTDVGRLYRSTSSIKYKKDVINYTRGLNEVMQLRPVFYKGISDNDGDKQFAGLIAEEVDELGLTEFVQYAEDGTPDALAYSNMIALLTKAVQELSAKVTALENK